MANDDFVPDTSHDDFVPDKPPPTWGQTALDVAKQIPSGIAAGVAALPGAIPTALGAIGHGVEAGIRHFGLETPEMAEEIRQRESLAEQGRNVKQWVPPLSSLLPAPETTAGEYARTGGEFLPAALAGPGGLARRVLTQDVVPAVASETAGQLTKGTEAEPYARVAGALTGAVGGMGTARALEGAFAPATTVSGDLSRALLRDNDTFEAVLGRLARERQVRPEATVADVAGENVKGLVERVAQTPGAGRTTVIPALTMRQQGQAGRIANDLTAMTGSRQSAFDATRETMAARAQAATPLYRQAYEDGDRAIWSTELGRLSASPTVRQAMQRAVRAWRDNAIADGYGAMNPGALIDRGGQLSFLSGRVPVFPNLQFWDYTKQALDTMARKMEPGTKPYRNVTTFARDLRTDLDQQVDSYARARQSWGGPSQYLEAIEDGRGILSRNITSQELASNLAEMTEAQREGYRIGALSAIKNKMRSNPAKFADMTRDLRSPEMREKIAAIMPTPEAAEYFTNALNYEVRSSEMFNRALGNSATARRQAEMDAGNSMIAEAAIAALSHGAHAPMHFLRRTLMAVPMRIRDTLRSKSDALLADILVNPRVSAQNVQHIPAVARGMAQGPRPSAYLLPPTIAGQGERQRGGRVQRFADGGAPEAPDYDYAAAQAAGVKPDERGHMPDTYKLPNHITFSDESVHHGIGGNEGGHWNQLGEGRWSFTPGKTNLQNYTPEQLQNYFSQYEPDSTLILPRQRFADGGAPDDQPLEYNPLADQSTANAPSPEQIWGPSWTQQALEQSKRDQDIIARGGGLHEMVQDSEAAQDLASGFGGGALGITKGAGAAMAAERMAMEKPFYSAVERAVTEAKTPQAPAQQWTGTLKNAPGVKPEELEHLGVEDFLKGQKGPVTKQALAEHIAENKVDVQEVERGGSPITPETTGRRADEILLEQGIRPDHPQYYEHLENAIQQATREQRPGGSTKFGQYTLPGGENYRELLLTLPTKRDPITPSALEELAQKRYEAYERQENDPPWVRLAPDIQQIYREQAAQKSFQVENPNMFRGSHWDEPNVLAHVRFDDRNIGGDKTLHLAEVQSDWHQKGRKEGYAGTREGKVAPQEGGLWKIEWNDGTFSGGYDTRTAAETAVGYRGKTGVPDAPFKTTWPELALKRMIRYAAENGYDRISWDTGVTSAERYDLSKQISHIDHIKNEDGSFDIHAYAKNGEQALSEEDIDEKRIADLVGKEVAEKIINGEGKPASDNIGRYYTEAKRLSGIDLKVGGEGMKAFYDRMLPNVANKLVKKYGARVEQTSVDAAARDPNGMMLKAMDPSAKTQVHSIKITPELRAKALHEGFPMFSTGIPIPHTGKRDEPTQRAHGGRVNGSRIDASHTVRTGANSSGGTVYVDHRIPAKFRRFLAVHETTEQRHMNGGYARAHKIATAAERKAVEASGMSWRHYTAEMDGYLDGIEHEKDTNPPKGKMHVSPGVALGHHRSGNKP